MPVMRWQAAMMWILVLTLAEGACSNQSPPAGDGNSDRSQPSASAGSTPSTQSKASAAYEGFLEKVACDAVSGWAWDASQPDAALTIDLYDGDRLLASTVADRFRQDLLDAGKGKGRHLFVEATPREIKDDQPHSIRALVRGTSFTLKPLEQAPSSIRCAR
jgi:hypothetical protein